MVSQVAKKIRFGAQYIGLRFRGLEWLFILGHMRSGSSLLVHLLNSNPEVLGYGETQIRYTGRRSFVQLHDHVRNQFHAHGQPPEGHYRYVMDKILWSHIRNDDLLRQVPISVIVIVRRPEAALPSILSLDIDITGSPEKALSYYLERLKRIREMLKIYGSSFVFTTYSDLTERTNETLQNISDYLALDKELTPTYDTMWSTGKPGIGDPSERIEAGEVQSRQRSYNVDIDSVTISQARDAYREFRSFCENLDYCRLKTSPKNNSC